MAGVNIYLTEREQDMVIKYMGQAVDILGEAEDTCDEVSEDMDEGLGSALRKIYKGRIGEEHYSAYKTKRYKPYEL